MRNVAFSVMLLALAVLQVAVVSTEVSHSKAHAAAVAQDESATARHVVASAETVRKTSTL